jgi:hypothetical protein
MQNYSLPGTYASANDFFSKEFNLPASAQVQMHGGVAKTAKQK